MAESITGDVPATAKWENEHLDTELSIVEKKFNQSHDIDFKLTADEHNLMSAADKMELVLFCTEQIMLGNSTMRAVRDRGVEYCSRLKFTDNDVFYRMINFLTGCYDECE